MLQPRALPLPLKQPAVQMIGLLDKDEDGTVTLDEFRCADMHSWLYLMQGPPWW